MNKQVVLVEIPGQFEVTLTQTRKGKSPRFTVQYGAQVVKNLTYSAACGELGSCIMHAATCDGRIDE